MSLAYLAHNVNTRRALYKHRRVLARPVSIVATAVMTGLGCRRVETILSLWKIGLNTAEIADRLTEYTEPKIERVLWAYREARRA